MPAEPGVYLLRDRAGAAAGKALGKVLYVGKAKSLRSRVRAYFREGGDTRFQVRFLMKRVGDFDVLVTHSEKEALILENNLIKQYRPRYNIRLKDDKSYLSAKMTNHPWPRIMVTRKIVRDGGKYFGPFGSAEACAKLSTSFARSFRCAPAPTRCSVTAPARVSSTRSSDASGRAVCR